ncbi:MAG TPA: substrate-binding domain-containing protein [Gemmataceae bacterium]|jgi:molybdate transport system regulatory protein|nr:substrate-binding domain-containing protein [Gemmataceae bacterium]
MADDGRALGADWAAGLRVWVERDGRAVLGQGRADLLEAIDHWHSISEAARRVGMSYRRAWLLVRAANEAAGRPLVETATGGEGGGGARLTEPGRRAVALYRELQARLRQAADGLLPELARPPEGPSVHVAAAISMEEVLGQLLADYGLRRPGVRVRAVFGASDELADNLLAGARADLFLAAEGRQLDRLEAARLVQAGSRTVLAENTLAAIGPAGRPADAGLVYHSDAARAAGCRLLFRARRPAVPIAYAAAVLRCGRQPGEARALLDFLASPAAAARYRRCGFLPARRA